MNLKKMGPKDGRWVELAQDRAHWRNLGFMVLNLLVILRRRWLTNMNDDCFFGLYTRILQM